jgi:SsrA-binding protein
MGISIIKRNKRAAYDFFLLEKMEAGLVLKGTEVKSLRQGLVRLEDAYVQVDENGEAWLKHLAIKPYEFGNRENHEEKAPRKCLLNKKEIRNLVVSCQRNGAVIVVLSLYFKGSRVKCEIAIAKGKKLHDKRESEAKRDVDRALQRGMFEK